jgi:hypothetical protein
MADAFSIEQFRAELARTGQHFLYSGEPEDDCASIRFTGTFLGEEVVWDATIMTLARYNAQQARDQKPAAQGQFIEIAPSGDHLRRIVIGLDLEEIDFPALLKTMIMVRKYKRLHTGRHDFSGAGRSE